MTKLKLNITMSLDGYVAWPNQDVEQFSTFGYAMKTAQF